jgi:hypothetical protein
MRTEIFLKFEHRRAQIVWREGAPNRSRGGCAPQNQRCNNFNAARKSSGSGASFANSVLNFLDRKEPVK